jgi:hypothetical protein
MRFTLARILLLAALPLSLDAQTGANTGITGTVVDPGGSVVQDAAVTITRGATGDTRSIRTDESGKFDVRFLTVGTYQIDVEAPKFRKLVRNGINVTTEEVASVRLELDLGQQSDAITVTADADMAQRESASIVKDIEGIELQNLPTSARNFTQLLLIEPGVSSDISEVLTNKNANISPSVNGARTTSNSIVYNGIDVTNMLCCSERSNGARGTIAEGGGSLSRNLAPAPETLSEVKMQTSLYDAATGRNGGANVILVSRSGTNEFHGSVYHFLQNEKLIANDFFFNRAGIGRQRLRRNEGGFTFGGPVVKNRTFFFGSYQYTQASTSFIDGASTTVRMPEALTNDRSDAGINAFARAVGVTNTSNINPTSRQFLQAQYPDGTFLIPSGAGGQNCRADDEARSCQITRVLPATYQQDQFTFSVDHQMSSVNRISVKGFWANQPSRDPLASSNASSLFEEEEETSQRTLSLMDTHLFGPRTVNEFRAGIFRNINNTTPIQYFTNAQFGINAPAAQRVDLARISIEPDDVGSEFEFGTPPLDVLDVQNTFTLGNTLSFNRGKHFLRFGGEYRHTQLNGNLAEAKNGEYAFESWRNFLTVGSGDGEQIDEVAYNYGETARAFRINDMSLFVADDWKITPRLTLNLGLRWDYFGWPWEKNGLIANFDPTLIASGQPLSAGYVFPSNYHGGILPDDQNVRRADTKSTLNNNLRNFAPRFGFAWSPLEGHGVVIRGGYGIYYDRASGALVNALRSSPPFFREQQLNDTSSYNTIPKDRAVFPPPSFRVSFDDGEPFLASTADPDEEFEALETQALGRKLGTPYIQQWNLTTQFPLGRSFLFDIGYVGTKGTKLMQFVNANPPVDVDKVGLLARPGVPGGGFTTNYFQVGRNDQFVPQKNPPCDLLDDPEECVIPAELRVPILGLDEDEGLNTLMSSVNSTYHSLQTSLQKRFDHGLGFKVNYTWSKSIDTYSDEGLFQAQNDQRALFLNRAISDFDRPHRLIFSFIWQLPFRGNKLVEGWSLSGIGTLQSGRPFTIVDEDFSGILYASTGPRPNIVSGATYDDLATSGSASERVGAFINTELVQSSGAQFGSLGRNVMRAPMQRRFDLSVQKLTRLTEQVGLEFRSEFYNLTNTSNFRVPESNLSSGDFGEILRSQGGPRVIQLALRLRF